MPGIQKVGTELLAGADDLSDWAAARGPGFFLPADNAVLAALARVSQWATAQQYEPVAVNTFFQVADYWLVGHALAHGHTVVTHEVPLGFNEADQDSQCLRRPWHFVCHAI